MDTLGRYKIVKEIGRGAMGVVYQGYDPKIDRIVSRERFAPQGNWSTQTSLSSMIQEKRKKLHISPWSI
jgi:serine/threonine protein kinase